MDIFHSDPDGVVKTLSKLLMKHRDSYEFPVECRSTAKLAVSEMALSKFRNDMDKYNFLKQSTVLLDNFYWDEIVNKVTQGGKKSNQVIMDGQESFEIDAQHMAPEALVHDLNGTRTEEMIEGSDFGLFYDEYMGKYKVSYEELKEAIANGKVRSRIFPDGLYVEDLPLYDSRIRLYLSGMGLSPLMLLLVLLLALLVWLFVSQVDGINDSEIVEVKKGNTTLVDSSITSIYSVYTGRAGIYESPFVMFLKNINGKYQGQYIYTRHQKWINLSGVENSEGYIELSESYQERPTGKILFKQSGIELNGEGFWGDTVNGQDFNAILRAKVDEIRKYPKDGNYVRNHTIKILNDGVFEKSKVSDTLAIQHFSDKGFTFYLYEITDNGHYGTLSGEAVYDGEKAAFITDDGCELTFSFEKMGKAVEYHAKALPEESEACYQFGGARSSLVHNEFIKVE